jgi:hypothetical protein
MWSDVIYLGGVVESIVNGEVSKSTTWRKVYGDKKSVRFKEFYEARLVDLKPELMFEIRSSEYLEEIKLKFDNKEYEIVRTYDKGEFIELICTRVLNG